MKTFGFPATGKLQKKKRLDSLRRKFAKDDRLFKEYEKFMEALMEKGYARKCDDKGPDGKT